MWDDMVWAVAGTGSGRDDEIGRKYAIALASNDRRHVFTTILMLHSLVKELQ